MHIVSLQHYEVMADGLTAGVSPALRVWEAQAGGLTVAQECGVLPRRAAGQLLAQAGGVGAASVLVDIKVLGWGVSCPNIVHGVVLCFLTSVPYVARFGCYQMISQWESWRDVRSTR